MEVIKTLWISLFLCPAVLAKQIDVCPSCMTSSVKDAIHIANPHDTIIIHWGIYPVHHAIIDKPLSIKGIQYPILDGGGQSHIFDIQSDQVSIEGLFLQNSGRSDIKEWAAIYVDHSSNCFIKKNILYNNTYAIYLAKAHYCRIVDNIIIGHAKSEVLDGNGFHLWYSSHITLIGNIITGQRDGIYMEFSSDLTIKNNISYNNLRYGMHFMFSHRNLFENNRFYFNPTGVAIMYSRNIRVLNNLFQQNRGEASYGILIKEIDDSEFYNNKIRWNSTGIFVDSSNRNRFENNQFEQNGWAIQIYGSCENNLFRYNQFLNNYFDVATNTSHSNDRYLHNYWSQHKAFDLNNDGIADRPYRPVSLFSYWVVRYPLLAVLFLSPVIEFLELMEKSFPVLTPSNLSDPGPLMKPMEPRESDDGKQKFIFNRSF